MIISFIAQIWAVASTGATFHIEVHHIRKLADLDRTGKNKPGWAQVMAARRRKTLVVCRKCHNQIHAGRYDGSTFST